MRANALVVSHPVRSAPWSLASSENGRLLAVGTLDGVQLFDTGVPATPRLMLETSRPAVTAAAPGAIETARAWRFIPARNQAGQPVAVVVQLEFDFKASPPPPTR